MIHALVAIGVLAGIELVWTMLWALLLRAGLRWAGVERVDTRKVVLATLIVLLTRLVYTGVNIGNPGSIPRNETLALLSPLMTGVLLPLVVISYLFSLTLLRTIRAWLPTLLSPALVFGLLVFVVRPYVIEAFVIPTNSMAPTLLGLHLSGTCPVCGSPAYGSPDQIDSGWNEWSAICRDRFHVIEPVEVDPVARQGDRLIVAKYLAPRRWDLVVFQMPEDPAVLYVMRVVGLPGETITIHHGRVFANGRRLSQPDAIRGLQWLDGIPESPEEFWGTTERPANLGSDEFFVLGDFSVWANDSRRWQRGAAGHHPYAVPQSHLHGVVVLNCTPLSRLRAFR